MSSLEWFFALLAVPLALVPWGLEKLGVKIPRWAVIAGLVVGGLRFIGALAIPAYRYWLTPKTFVYLFPGRALGEKSAQTPHELVARRVFVLQQAGPDALSNVEVTLRDNHATGQTAADHIETYPEVRPGKPDHELQPKHFWFQPAIPWDEDYTITLKSGEKSFLEHILIRGLAPKGVPGTSVNPPPPPKVTPSTLGAHIPADMGRVDLAIRLTEEGSNEALYSCHDDSLWHEAEWSKDEPKPCPEFATETSQLEAGLDPKPYVLAYPSGLFDMTPPEPPLSSHPESERSKRELSGWQQEQMQKRLENFSGNKLLIVAAGDS
jgi:hypothetical protein